MLCLDEDSRAVATGHTPGHRKGGAKTGERSALPDALAPSTDL